MTAEEKLREWKKETIKPMKMPAQSPEETIKRAMGEHSRASGLPKDWRSRTFKGT